MASSIRHTHAPVQTDLDLEQRASAMQPMLSMHAPSDAATCRRNFLS